MTHPPQGPWPTVRRAELRVEHSDGTAYVLVLDGALACETSYLPADTPPGKETWQDGLLFDAPGGLAQLVLTPPQEDKELRVRFLKARSWRLAIRPTGADVPWPDQATVDFLSRPIPPIPPVPPAPAD